ncbi:ABC transporter ATP-binding protein/permease [Aphanothece sacrum]|uniref:Microcystin synthase n=1 Tax=Aphanothece sacrum FPU1 TaxID=1920663 RepID=A0A401IGB2_APHSA|nr:ATP-binding cassette domain-containing protein [Aphanothece sacrum]GBF80251.1 Microcystin synthase [Aphanothece sacrum FPU1]GBF83656.1 peptide synthetase [Aphanothece sacrum FPU3]
MQVSENLMDNMEREANTSFNNTFLLKLLSFLQLYWYPKESENRAFSEIIRAWGMLFLLVVFLVILVALNALNSFIFRDLIDVIEEKNLPVFNNMLILYSFTLLGVIFFTGFSKFFRKLIALDWYQWINKNILQEYFSNRAYYKINFQSEIENPDQRLAQEIEPIARTIINFGATCLEKIMEMVVFMVILWSISQTIAIILIVCTILGNIIAVYLSDRLNKINQEKLEVEANYNYALTHVRTHAESIAFFRGETQELNIIQRRFNEVIDQTFSKIDWEKNQELFKRAYQATIQIFPFLIVAPIYIRGDIDFGEVTQVSYACHSFANALAALVDEVGDSGRFISYIERFDSLSNALKKVGKQRKDVSTINVIEENHIAFENVTLQTPDYAKVIVENLSVSVEPGQGLLIVGPSGRGKSSLLRAIAGLWNSGTGDLLRPSLEDMLFLPQRPYIILGNLREQLLYPKTNRYLTESELTEILEEVNLQNIVTKVESFEAEVPWENILSLGEQQRLAFARLLVNNSNFIILDEATSALDLQNEANLYTQLQQTGKTFISVGHRESLFNYHHKVLELSEDSSWHLVDMKDYQLSQTPLEKSLSNKNIETKEKKAAEIGENSLKIETTTGLSHEEMEQLSKYALNTIRSKASRGKTIVAEDGFTYRYDKNPNILKWVKVINNQ